MDYAPIREKPVGDEWRRWFNKLVKTITELENNVQRIIGNASMPDTRESFPIGSVFISIVNADPKAALGYGSWTTLGSDTLFSTTVYAWKRVA